MVRSRLGSRSLGVFGWRKVCELVRIAVELARVFVRLVYGLGRVRWVAGLRVIVRGYHVRAVFSWCADGFT